MVVQELALHHPALVRTLTIGCSWAGGPDAQLSETAHRIVAAIATRDPDHALRTSFEANFSPAYGPQPGRFEHFARLALTVRVPARVVQRQLDAALRHDTVNRLPGITAPTLVLHGTADAGMDQHHGERIAALIPSARLELFDGVGHLFWWEDPDRTVRLLHEHTGAAGRAG